MPRRSAFPTMREIAKRASVSIGTVSRVLNRHEDVDSELRGRVESIAREVGYEFSARTRSVVQTKSRIIGRAMFFTISVPLRQMSPATFSGSSK